MYLSIIWMQAFMYPVIHICVCPSLYVSTQYTAPFKSLKGLEQGHPTFLKHATNKDKLRMFPELCVDRKSFGGRLLQEDGPVVAQRSLSILGLSGQFWSTLRKTNSMRRILNMFESRVSRMKSEKYEHFGKLAVVQRAQLKMELIQRHFYVFWLFANQSVN